MLPKYDENPTWKRSNIGFKTSNQASAGESRICPKHNFKKQKQVVVTIKTKVGMNAHKVR